MSHFVQRTHPARKSQRPLHGHCIGETIVNRVKVELDRKGIMNMRSFHAFQFRIT